MVILYQKVKIAAYFFPYHLHHHHPVLNALTHDISVHLEGSLSFTVNREWKCQGAQRCECGLFPG